MVSVSSVAFSKVENGDLFGKLGLTNQAQRIKELRGANEVVFESALGQGANMNTANHDAETQLGMAIQYKKTETADLIRKHNSKTSEELKAEGK